MEKLMFLTIHSLLQLMCCHSWSEEPLNRLWSLTFVNPKGLRSCEHGVAWGSWLCVLELIIIRRIAPCSCFPAVRLSVNRSVKLWTIEGRKWALPRTWEHSQCIMWEEIRVIFRLFSAISRVVRSTGMENDTYRIIRAVKSLSLIIKEMAAQNGAADDEEICKCYCDCIATAWLFVSLGRPEWWLWY